ncbi:MAG: hypothetical protein K0V04_42140 [Deltaproteobacteria bacterium]|nr:hypothetical protein [Deltaproteobacteria bacterium]
MNILTDTTASFEVWQAEQLRRPRAWIPMREDPEIFALARRLIRDVDNRSTMTSLVEDTLARNVPGDAVAERFAELVTFGQLVLRERPQDAYPLPDPYAFNTVDLTELSASEPLVTPSPMSAPTPMSAPAPMAAPAPPGALPSMSMPALPGPPTPAEIGITSDSITHRAMRVELQEIIDFYSKDTIREDVRQRVWSDIREDPNKVVVIRSLMGEAEVLPSLDDLTVDDIVKKTHSDVGDVLQDLFRKAMRRGPGR